MREIPTHLGVRGVPRHNKWLEQKYVATAEEPDDGYGERRQKPPRASSFRRGMQSLTDALASIDASDGCHRAPHPGRIGQRRLDRRGRTRRRTVMRRAKAIVLATPAPGGEADARSGRRQRGTFRHRIRRHRERRVRVPPRQHPATRRLPVSSCRKGITPHSPDRFLEQHVRGSRASEHRAADDLRGRHAQPGTPRRDPTASSARWCENRGTRRRDVRRSGPTLIGQARFRNTTLGHAERLPLGRRARPAQELFFCGNYRGEKKCPWATASNQRTRRPTRGDTLSGRRPAITAKLQVFPHFQHRSNVAGESSPHAAGFRVSVDPVSAFDPREHRRRPLMVLLAFQPHLRLTEISGGTSPTMLNHAR